MINTVSLSRVHLFCIQSLTSLHNFDIHVHTYLHHYSPTSHLPKTPHSLSSCSIHFTWISHLSSLISINIPLYITSSSTPSPSLTFSFSYSNLTRTDTLFLSPTHSSSSQATWRRTIDITEYPAQRPPNTPSPKHTRNRHTDTRTTTPHRASSQRATTLLSAHQPSKLIRRCLYVRIRTYSGMRGWWS